MPLNSFSSITFAGDGEGDADGDGLAEKTCEQTKIKAAEKNWKRNRNERVIIRLR